MRILLPSRWPLLALLVFTPAIPELLTGSTPIGSIAFDPVGFVIDYAFLLGLYGAGALLVREFAVYFHKGWASILLLGGAYGILEEGFAVHTFFQPSGSPVDALAVFGHAGGVNWLWALGISAFHATYSIALPILLVGLWFPEVRTARWFDSGGLAVIGLIYLATVVVFSTHERFAPRAGLSLFFLAVVAVLIALAWRAPADLLSVRAGASRAGKWPLILIGTVGFDAWLLLLALASARTLPAPIVGGLLVAINLGVLAFLLVRVGSTDLERSEFYFATGMLIALWVWDVPVDLWVPGILGVAAGSAYLQYRLGRRIAARDVLDPGRSAPGGPDALPPAPR
ncbi:MAG: hypothetical protein WBG19_03830 [Thermoplasmata archaeon]